MIPNLANQYICELYLTDDDKEHYVLSNEHWIIRGELIRCKECRYWQDNNGGYPHPDCKWMFGETPDSNDYCSGAEKISK